MTVRARYGEREPVRLLSTVTALVPLVLAVLSAFDVDLDRWEQTTAFGVIMVLYRGVAEYMRARVTPVRSSPIHGTLTSAE